MYTVQNISVSLYTAVYTIKMLCICSCLKKGQKYINVSIFITTIKT